MQHNSHHHHYKPQRRRQTQAMNDENSETRFSSLTPTSTASNPAATDPESPNSTPPKGEIFLRSTPPKPDYKLTSNPSSSESAALDFIKRRQHHKSINQPLRLGLTQSEYKNLLTRLEELPELKSFVDDKLKWEYNPIQKILYIPHMPSVRHESFSEQVSHETKCQLNRIASGNDEAARFAARISSVKSGSIYLREFDSNDDIDSELGQPCIERQPDEQFQHEEAEYPGVVYEIASSQSHGNLELAAWDYIPYSNGDIKAMVGFELGYGSDKVARVYMWQPRYVMEKGIETLGAHKVIDRDPFRSSQGSPVNPDKELHLPLDLFATSEVTALDNEELPSITITYGKLSEFLNKAERLQQIKQPQSGSEIIGKKSTRRTKKRKREETPTELPTKKEREFRNAENKDERHTKVQDRAFYNRAGNSMNIPVQRELRKRK